jgi:hypothetical protein
VTVHRPDGEDRRTARFDRELRLAAQGLVGEELPRGVLDPAVAPRLGRPAPVLATLAAAVVILVVAVAIAGLPRGFGGPGPGSSASVPASAAPSVAPAFRTTAEIRADLVTLRYSCIAGPALASIGPGADAIARQSAVCNAPADIGPLLAAVIVGESADGRVVEAHAKSDIVGADTPAARAAVAAVLGKDAAIIVVAGRGDAVAAWVDAKLPVLEKNDATSTVIDGVALRLDRSATGGYELEMTRTGAS